MNLTKVPTQSLLYKLSNSNLNFIDMIGITIKYNEKVGSDLMFELGRLHNHH